jgi:hypothetical protein
MSHFYGTIKGQAKSEATRRGSRTSGMETHCASWAGAIRCTAYVINGVDCVRVAKVPWHGRGVKQVLYSGPIGEAP